MAVYRPGRIFFRDIVKVVSLPKALKNTGFEGFTADFSSLINGESLEDINYLTAKNGDEVLDQRKLIGDDGEAILDAVMEGWREAVKVRILLIQQRRNYLDVLLAFLNVALTHGTENRRHEIAAKFNSNELVSLIAEICVLNSKYIEIALQKSTFVVLHKFLAFESFSFMLLRLDIYNDDRFDCFLNMKDTTYNTYCDGLLGEMVSILLKKHDSDTESFVTLLNSVFKTLEESKVILPNVDHYMMRMIDDVRQLKTLIEPGYFCPSIEFDFESTLFQKSLFRVDRDISKYFMNINFLTKSDIYELPWCDFIHEGNLHQESQELLAEMRQVPTLYRITLVTVSAMIGPLPNRKSLVSKLNIPPALQRALTYQSAK